MTTEPNNRGRIKMYLALDEEDLYSMLPEHVPKYAHVVFHPAGQVAAGQKVFNAMQNALYEAVCVKWQYCKRRNEPDLQDSVALVAAVADVVVSVCGGIPSCLIAALLVKKGLNSFCGCNQHLSQTDHNRS